MTPNETRPVDKSRLARLVEGLESRLKDLDDIDSTMLESAKALLTEIKQALNDESLTESDLRDIVRKSERGNRLLQRCERPANQEKDQMKDDSQTTTEFSYVVMIGSLLALLGLLLFLIARRKKRVRTQEIGQGTKQA